MPFFAVRTHTRNTSVSVGILHPLTVALSGHAQGLERDVWTDLQLTEQHFGFHQGRACTLQLLFPQQHVGTCYNHYRILTCTWKNSASSGSFRLYSSSLQDKLKKFLSQGDFSAGSWDATVSVGCYGDGDDVTHKPPPRDACGSRPESEPLLKLWLVTFTAQQAVHLAPGWLCQPPHLLQC